MAIGEAFAVHPIQEGQGIRGKVAPYCEILFLFTGKTKNDHFWYLTLKWHPNVEIPTTISFII